jgi:hypothetical protein
MTKQLNNKGGSFLPADDDFFNTPQQGRKAAAPAPTSAQAPTEPLSSEDEDEDVSSRLTRVTPPPAASELPAGMNGVPEMQGGLPEIFLKEAKMLGIEITDEDVMTYVFKGSISKEVPVIKNLLSVQLRTLTSAEISDVNLRMSERVKERPDMIQKEYHNQNTMLLFTYAVTAMGKPGKLRQLPADFDKRYEQLGQLAPQVIAKLSHRYNLLEFLLQDKLSDEAFVKNS